MKLSLSLSSFSVLSSRATAACTMSLARKRFLKPKWTPNVWTRMSFILMRRYREGEKKPRTSAQKFLLGALFEVMAKHINTGTYSRPINGYPYLLEDSSMMSRRFSLIDVSMELNFCFTCFRGSLFNGSRKTSHTVHRLTLFLVVYTPNSFLLPSGSPHVRQELLKFLLPVYGPELKAA